jgi:hypothetical protein
MLLLCRLCFFLNNKWKEGSSFLNYKLGGWFFLMKRFGWLDKGEAKGNDDWLLFLPI